MVDQQTLHALPGYNDPYPSAVGMPKPAGVQFMMPMQQMNVAQASQSNTWFMQGAPMPITAYPRPPYVSPHSYLAAVLITFIICLLLNITSLAFGIPALIFSICSYNAIQNKKWKSAEKYGKWALYLTIANWIYVLSLAVFFIGLSLGLYYRPYYY